MSKISEIRRVIRSFGGKKFNTTEIRKASQYGQAGQRLDDLERVGEIEKLDIVKIDGRATREWREIKINVSLMNPSDIKLEEFAKEKNPWEDVYPEYFRDPMLPGDVRQFIATL